MLDYKLKRNRRYQKVETKHKLKTDNTLFKKKIEEKKFKY